MRCSARMPWGEVRVGLVIIFAFSVLMWAAFNGSGLSFFQKTNTLQAYFSDVEGLANGSPVWLAGIEVGHVSSIRFVEHSGNGVIHVRFEVNNTAWPMISARSTVAIGTIGLMGDKYISVSVRQPGDPPVTEDAVLQTRVAADMSTAFASAPKMMDKFSATLKHLNTILERLERGEGYLGRLTSNGSSSDQIDSLVTSSRRLVAELTDSQRRLVRSIEHASTAFDSLADGVLNGGGSLSRLVWDTTLYTNLSSITARADSMVARWQSGRGTFDKLASDSSMYVEVRDLVTDTRALLDDIMANPRKYFKFSIF